MADTFDYTNGQSDNDRLLVVNLWKNTSPQSNFGAQTLSGFDLANAKAVRIFYAQEAKASPTMLSPLIVTKEFPNGNFHYAFFWEGNAYYTHRYCSVNFADGTIRIENCQQDTEDGSLVKNEKCIPLLICIEK